jgi:hypothetical protein
MTILLLLALAAPVIHAQNQEGVLNWAPTPAGPNEPVRMPAHALLTPAERTPILELLDRAQQNLFLFVLRGTPFKLKLLLSPAVRNTTARERWMSCGWRQTCGDSRQRCG